MHQRRPNRLVKETSPYLLQHAENPVDWYPWSDEALTLARTEDKPILLSIGYSACHWCHVMAHESFENEETARLMNESFVNIKVDREERPDLDTVYMEAVQSITSSGGWPLTVFLTPEGEPFYGGTYFPPQDGHGVPGFPRVLRTVSDAYRNRRREVEQATRQIVTALSSRVAGDTDDQPLVFDILKRAYSAIRSDFDSTNGGFGQAPKFPQPMVLEFLLKYYHRSGNREALHMVTQTLEKLVKGGIYDQIGGGFHRYATDSRWMVPHFEKMLYDNALLSQVYLHAYLATEAPLFRRIAEEIINYVLREMTSPQGGFYSTQDADSEGIEGKYYVWAYEEVREALGETTAGILVDYYGMTGSGNFEGRNILHLTGELKPEEPAIIKQAKSTLLKERKKRTPPGRDEKVLVSWNGLMLASLAEAASVLDRKDYLGAAVASGSFLLNSAIGKGYLRHVYSHSQAKIEGYLEDYALVIDGLLNLHQATFSGKWLSEAIRLAEIMIEEFWDESADTFYDTGKRHQVLFVRPRNAHDGASPSGASAATLALLRLSRVTDSRRMEEISVKSVMAMRRLMSQYPLGFGNWLCALDFYLSRPKEVVIIGPPDHESTIKMKQAIFGTWLPNKIIAAVDPNDPTALTDLRVFNGKTMLNGKPTVYLCEGYSCQTPATDPDSLRNQLQKFNVHS